MAAGAAMGQGRAPVAWVNGALILACAGVFAAGVPGERLAFVPAWLFGAEAPRAWVVVKALFGHVLIHADSLHLAANVIALRLFGNRVEAGVGHGAYAGLLVLCAAAAALAEGAVTTVPLVPLVGASGAIAGVMAAHLVLFPRARILTVIPAALLIGADLAANVGFALLPLPDGWGAEDVAWGAHLGGFALGALLALPFKVRSRRPVPAEAPPGGAALALDGAIAAGLAAALAFGG